MSSNQFLLSLYAPMDVCSVASCVQLFATPWTGACQFPLTMRFSQQEYWSGSPCPPPGDRPDPGIKPAPLRTPTLASRFFTTSAAREALKAWFSNFKNESYSGWLCWVFVALCGLSLVAGRGGYSSLWCRGFSLWWLPCGVQALECAGFSGCDARA